MANISAQKITTTNKTEVSLDVDSFKSMVFTNTHATDAVSIDLWIVDQNGSSVTATDVYVNTSYVGSTPGISTAVTVDNGSGADSDAADDEFLNERIYDSAGNFHGICTAVASLTSLTFGSGLIKSLANNTILHVGTRFFLLNNIEIPNGVSFRITGSDFDFDNNNYNLYINSSDANGNIDIITRY